MPPPRPTLPAKLWSPGTVRRIRNICCTTSARRVPSLTASKALVTVEWPARFADFPAWIALVLHKALSEVVISHRKNIKMLSLDALSYGSNDCALRKVVNRKFISQLMWRTLRVLDLTSPVTVPFCTENADLFKFWKKGYSWDVIEFKKWHVISTKCVPIESSKKEVQSPDTELIKYQLFDRMYKIEHTAAWLDGESARAITVWRELRFIKTGLSTMCRQSDR